MTWSASVGEDGTKSGELKSLGSKGRVRSIVDSLQRMAPSVSRKPAISLRKSVLDPLMVSSCAGRSRISSMV